MVARITASQHCPRPGDDRSYIVASVLTLARGLDIAVTAEGVETKQQFELLRGAGVHQVQGYLFGKPMPADEFWKLLETGRTLPP